MRRTSEADVIVVGAGPAGCAHAIWCALHGLDVVLFERQPFPRDRAGETLHPGIESLFAQLGVAEQMTFASPIRPNGYWIARKGDIGFVPYAPATSANWCGYQILGRDCDAILLDRARQVGVSVVQPCDRVDIRLDHDRATGILHKEQLYASRFVIDATGGARWLSRQLKLPSLFRSARLNARYGYAEGECAERNCEPWFEIDRSHWLWTARIRPGLYYWSAVRFDSERMQTPEIFRGMARSEKVYGADVTWRCLENPSGSGYFVIGDAATVVDPASSHGVIRALMAGLQSAHLLLLTFAGALTESEASQRYNSWLRQSFDSETATLSGLYRHHHPGTYEIEV
jgi:flavin-dependent dehydrogenase